MIGVRPLEYDQYEEWYPLWQEYLKFYQSSVSDEVTKNTWERFHQPDQPMWALGAFQQDQLIGIVHYLYHRTCWSSADNCYLQDLFAIPEVRGRGVGRALSDAVHEVATKAGANTVYWMTQESNKTAQLLYDRVANRTGFVHYEKPLLKEKG